MSVVTVETSEPKQGYTLFGSPNTPMIIHLAGGAANSGTGPCLCGFDRHARDEEGNHLYGFSVGGGTSGGNTTHRLCYECLVAAGDSPRRGTNAHLFDNALAGVTDENGVVWVLSEDGLFRSAPETDGVPRERIKSSSR